MINNNKLLVVVAHPDDEIIGAGGTIAKYIKKNFDVYIIYLSSGEGSRDGKVFADKRIKSLEKCCKYLNVKQYNLFDLPDNRFDSVPMLDIIQMIENLIIKIDPTVIITHSDKDLNVDHVITFQVVKTIARPGVLKSLNEVYSMFVNSSTDWNFSNNFNDKVYVDVSDYIEIKKKCLEFYKDELRPEPHSRSIENILNTSKFYGSKAFADFVEPFELVWLKK